ncbi:MAG: hypothetical protein QOD69_3133, partial [Solirubrobacteraceae bacterium]|nr:hypothetical protein [Solirubrobacteraceae bacterium]
MTLRLRPAVHWAVLPDGLFLSNWDTSFTLGGHRSLPVLFERLVPALEQGVERNALLDAVPENARRATAYLLEELLARDMLLDAAALAPPPEPDVAAAHAQALAFLESVAKDPYAAFAAVRAAQLTVEGEEEAVRAAARALIGLGVGTVTTSEGDGLRIGAVEAVLGRDAIVGRRAAEALGCWTGRGDVDFSGPCGPLVARLAGNVAAYQAFRELSGLAQNAAEVTVVRAAGLETTIHPVRPPGPGVPDEDPGAEAFLDALDPLLDPLFGLLEAPQPGELPQLPLRLAAVGDRLGFAAGGAEARRRALLAAAAPSGAGGCAGVTVTGWLADGLLRLALG